MNDKTISSIKDDAEFVRRLDALLDAEVELAVAHPAEASSTGVAIALDAFITYVDSLLNDTPVLAHPGASEIMGWLECAKLELPNTDMKDLQPSFQIDLMKAEIANLRAALATRDDCRKYCQREADQAAALASGAKADAAPRKVDFINYAIPIIYSNGVDTPPATVSNTTAGASIGDDEVFKVLFHGVELAAQHRIGFKPAADALIGFLNHRLRRAPAVGMVVALDLVAAGALRQLRHNDGSDGFVFAYDKKITDRELTRLAAPDLTMRDAASEETCNICGLKKEMTPWGPDCPNYHMHQLDEEFPK